jgi:nucleotide-binding universal stress UspA family protein
LNCQQLTGPSVKHGLALARTADLVPASGAELHLVTVGRIPEYVETIDEVEEAKEQATRHYAGPLEEAERFLAGKGMSAKVHSAYGKPSEEILRVADELRADLIVLGTRPHHPVKRRLMGGTADKVVDHANCSVLVVK